MNRFVACARKFFLGFLFFSSSFYRTIVIFVFSSGDGVSGGFVSGNGDDGVCSGFVGSNGGVGVSGRFEIMRITSISD